jgi:hypothetical protein
MLGAIAARAEGEAALKPAPEAVTKNLLEELNRALESRDAVILELLHRVEELENRARANSEAERRVVEAPKVVSDEQAINPTHKSFDYEPAEFTWTSADEELDEADKLAQAALERTLIESGSLLLPAGVMEIQPRLGYGLISAHSVNIDCGWFGEVLCIGDIDSQYVRRESFFFDLIYRLGLPWNMQLDVRVPIGYDTLNVDFANQAKQEADAFGVGDVELSLSGQLLRERDWMPGLVGAFRWKSTSGSDPFDTDEDSLATGSGFNDFQLSFTSTKVRDPVVLFSNLSYTFRLSDEKQGVGRVDLGDIAGLQLGMAVALNLETSLSFGWSQSWVQETSLDGSKIGGTFDRPGSLRIGATYVPAAGRSIDFGVAVGVTDGAPDVEASLSFPIRLPYRIPFPSH